MEGQEGQEGGGSFAFPLPFPSPNLEKKEKEKRKLTLFSFSFCCLGMDFCTPNSKSKPRWRIKRQNDSRRTSPRWKLWRPRWRRGSRRRESAIGRVGTTRGRALQWMGRKKRKRSRRKWKWRLRFNLGELFQKMYMNVCFVPFSTIGI